MVIKILGVKVFASLDTLPSQFLGYLLPLLVTSSHWILRRCSSNAIKRTQMGLEGIIMPCLPWNDRQRAIDSLC